MSTIETTLAEGDVLQAWMKPRAGGAGRLAVTVEGVTHEVTVEGPSDRFLPASWTSPAAGKARLSWEEEATELSLLYAFTPRAVAADGIRLLHATDDNRLGEARHALHFHPPFGWMNDPNGLCEVDGVTHLFYQHNPHRRRWDMMHWGHALSRDGVRWVHQPLALLPREGLLRDRGEQGGAYSGSALPLPGGSLRLFYTERQDSRRPASEHQFTALVDDGVMAGPSTRILDAHPALPGYRNDWRDPYVFRAPDGGLRMLLGGADADSALVLLYASTDPTGAGGWHFVDVLFRERIGRPIPAECPCMIPLRGEGEGLWMLTFGLIGSRHETTRRRNLARTHIGRFDGRTFAPSAEHELDFGGDCYAMQVWDAADGPRGIAWAANWTDVYADRDFESAMTFPRRFLWEGGRLRTPPIDAVDTLRAEPLPGFAAAGGAVACPEGRAELDLAFSEPGTPFTLHFDHPGLEASLHYDGRELELRYEPPGHRSVPRYLAPYPELRSCRVLIDVGLLEIFVDGGRACCTKRLDSAAPVTAARLVVEGEGLARGDAWALRPANRNA